MNTGRPISTEVADYLYSHAKKMARNRETRKRLESRLCKGILVTDWKYGSMGTLSGLEFKAEIVTDTGETEITFLVLSTDAHEEGGWFGFDNERSLDEFVARAAMQEKPDRSRLN